MVPEPDRVTPAGQLVLASGSIYRARLLRDAGYAVVVDPPEVDERCEDHLLGRLGPDGLAVRLARRKVRAVARRHRGEVILGGDQVGVVPLAGESHQLHKQPDARSAVAQLMRISGTTHRLHNGMFVLDVDSGAGISDVDVTVVTMRKFDEAEAREYVERFEPFDSAGSYRMEDGAAMAPLEPFVTEVSAEDDSAVLGVPLLMLERMLADLRRITGRGD